MNALTASPAMPVKRTREFRLRLPALLLWLLLLPLAPLLMSALLVVSALHDLNPLRAAAALARVAAGLKGIHVEVQTREVSIAIGLF